MSPTDGDFVDAVAALAGDEENFRIEAPALDGLQLEDGLRGGAGEGLEAALRVSVGKAHDGAGDAVETAAEKLPIERLANGLAGALEPAGTDGDVGAGGDGGEETVGLLNGRGEIGVGEHDHFTERVKNAVAHAVALAVIAGILEQPDLGVGFGEGADDFGGLVAGAIIDHDDLGAPAALMDAGDNLVEGVADARGLVIGGNHDAVGRIGHSRNTKPRSVPQPAAGAMMRGGGLSDMIAHPSGWGWGGWAGSGFCPKLLMHKG